MKPKGAGRFRNINIIIKMRVKRNTKINISQFIFLSQSKIQREIKILKLCFEKLKGIEIDRGRKRMKKMNKHHMQFNHQSL